jgi:hypothetical protein
MRGKGRVKLHRASTLLCILSIFLMKAGKGGTEKKTG